MFWNTFRFLIFFLASFFFSICVCECLLNWLNLSKINLIHFCLNYFHHFAILIIPDTYPITFSQIVGHFVYWKIKEPKLFTKIMKKSKTKTQNQRKLKNKHICPSYWATKQRTHFIFSSFSFSFSKLFLSFYSFHFLARNCIIHPAQIPHISFALRFFFW